MTTKIRWHLPSLAQDKGILGPSALQEVLGKHGYVLSVAQASRLLRHPPVKVDVSMLRALCKIFACGLADLLDLGLSETPSQDVKPSGADKKMSPEESHQWTGPPAVALRPIPARAGLRSVE